MILVGIDDTDVPGSRGTNQLARAVVDAIGANWRCVRIVRHQLLVDPRVPCTTKNGSASIALEPARGSSLQELIAKCRDVIRQSFVAGSDPGLCVATAVPEAVTQFGRRCQRDLAEQREARELAARHAIYLQGLGGTEGGVIGALAAVGLAATGDDGRIVWLGQWPDELSGLWPVAELHRRDVVVHELDTGNSVAEGRVDVGKKLRPNRRGDRNVLFVRRRSRSPSAPYEAVRLP